MSQENITKSYYDINYEYQNQVKALIAQFGYVGELANTFFNYSGYFKQDYQKQAVDLYASISSLIQFLTQIQSQIKKPVPDYVQDTETNSIAVVADCLIEVVTKKTVDFYKENYIKVTGNLSTVAQIFESYVDGVVQIEDTTLPAGYNKLNLIVRNNPVPLDIGTWSNKIIFFSI